MSPPGPNLGSTYRLQLHGIGFRGARDLVGYLSDLGIDTLYVSPVLAAAPGSTHGYDVIDPGRLDPALGTPEEFEALLGELEAHRMRLLVDMVPNHMAAVPANCWWWEVLREGREAEHAPVFDIDWSWHGGRVLVPTLGRPLADAVGDARYADDGDERQLELDGQRFPLAPGTRAGYDPSAVLERQHYRPAYWRLNNDEGNYRRFFDIDGLVGVRVEEPAVFERTHGFLTELGQDERIAGWRVDHIDGLTDPGAYLRRWAATLAARRSSRAVVLVEKILAPDEVLRPDWPVDGTTGYEFANLAGGLFVNQAGAHLLARAAQELTGAEGTFANLAQQAKREVLVTSFPAALERVSRATQRALDDSHPGHDLSLHSVRAALAELTVQLDVYRTYFDGGPPDRADRTRLARAAAAATAAADGAGEADPLPEETARALGLITEGFSEPEGSWLAAVGLWQQLTGAVMAKGVEDTATYRHPGLLSHADVGGDPDRAAVGPEQFHRLAEHQQRYPSSLNTTSTHDSKRSEDARARLFTLSELPSEWAGLVARWHGRYRPGVAGPDALDELVAYQSLFCLWPPDSTTLPPAVRRRVQGYLVKAARESKRHTSWVEPHPSYERALTRFVGRLCRDAHFGAEMGRFVRRVAPAAATNSLSMLVLKSVAPGVPDLYQGAELWDHSLTDPDNRRPVNFGRRRSLLSGLPAQSAPPDERTRAAKELLSDWNDGRLKLHLTRSLLHLRRDHPELFARGMYHALEPAGPAADHVVSLARRRGRHWVVAVVPRQTIALAGTGRFPVGTRTWGTTTLRLPESAPCTFTDVVTGASVIAQRGRLQVAECLSVLPIAVLLG
jgi:(1->4)-alpha-D-glucan 1-alpha-D-glucosylmutase